ncbi:diguanylate cyclase (GGDEF)-like protein [Rhodothalassium salexigens DSM 2132]|uniref:Diguanylate cyclase (GGDEF)-like protein n=1 Tax=Rhodothalassium salexigens DSM 2132 TaxID=1188247 RepID=A0A4R2PUL6_RHOSA|nr:bifunctional diguanylate cyclase/phosphodiesterase [Rhodothalassium salexigens]MBB4210582.1 diguanylate cyclase (GGDEF)-like protein [Rhodothalassium salexigens DSM 2132]MBK1639734.1 hypothetical protein [Rhodothalassium salexigens DSM 2132]TCP37861.1 diguanylate cyclase (GGDEF)-like protein [Rhodothalassium salexigens DSM 2132]
MDRLTGTLTRMGFVSQLDSAAEIYGLDTLLLVNLQVSRFGWLNNGLGVSLGDKVLHRVARRLQKTFPGALSLGRLHGDHFALLFGPDIDRDEVVERLLDFSQRPIALEHEVIVLSIRIGVADREARADSAQTLLHSAEVALHRAKATAAKVVHFDASMVREATDIFRLENDLRVALVKNKNELHRALHNEEFFLCFQPIVDIARRRVHAFEALIRWRHPRRGLIPPATFVPVAEQIGLMDVLGAWVFRMACQAAARWPADPTGDKPAVSINVSPTQFAEPRLIMAMIQSSLAETGLEPERLEVELTENALASDDLRQPLQSIQDLGCAVSLDDFGTGYSSITKLQAMPLDYVKIDRSFVNDLCAPCPEARRKARELTQAVIALGQVLSLVPIVEGTETQDQVDVVSSFGATLFQGYHFARPLPESELDDYLTNFSRCEVSE